MQRLSLSPPLPFSRLRLWLIWITMLLAGMLVAGDYCGLFHRTDLTTPNKPSRTVEAKPQTTPHGGSDHPRVSPKPAPRITKPLINPHIVILKNTRQAELYSGDQLIKSYKIALGANSTGHKKQKGDGRTPEGQYRLCSRLERSQFHIFLGLNYPTVHDAQQGLKRGEITKKDAQRIAEAERKHQMPPWDTPLSGAIGLHGGGADSDWTLGCIAFDNRDIEELLTATNHWTPVEIRP